MRRSLVVIGLFAFHAPALAAPLGQAWRTAKGCASTEMRRGPSGVFGVIPKKSLLGYDLATGKPAPPRALPGKYTYVAEVIGDTVVVGVTGKFAGLDAATGKLRWKRAASRMARAGDDVVVVAGKGKQLTVERLGAATGATAWKVKPELSGTVDWIAGDATRAVLGAASKTGYTLRALDGKTGATAWSTTLAIKVYHAPQLADARIVIPDAGDGLRVLDAATGKSLAQVATPNQSTTLAAQGRAYVIEGADQLTAYDLATAKPSWKLALAGGDWKVEGVTAAGLVIHGDSVVAVVDPATGKLTSRFGVAERRGVLVADRAPAIVTCDGPELVAIDPSAAGSDETATVRGRVTCQGCTSPTLVVRINGVTATTDDQGAFTLKLTGRGRFRVDARDASDEDHGFEPAGAVLLTGKGSYDVGALHIDAQVDGD